MNMQQTFQSARNGDGTKADIKILGGSAEINDYLEKINSGGSRCTSSPRSVDKKKSKNMFCPVAALWPTMKPPPPRLVKAGSATAEANPAATTASKAFPPCLKYFPGSLTNQLMPGGDDRSIKPAHCQKSPCTDCTTSCRFPVSSYL
jgi:hypothetical protein